MKTKSILLAVLAAMFAVSMAGAQSGDPATAQNDALKVRDQNKEQPKKDQPAPRLIEFHFAAAPWAQVLDWLKDTTGLPIVTNIRPTGSLTFIPPKGPDGTNKKYTVAEIIDVLNESLLAQKLVIVRRAGSITIWSADEPLPLELVKSVTLEQLNGDLGKTEFVRLNYPLRILEAQEFAPSVKKLMGTFGSVIPLEEANQLILIDNVANLRIVVNMINDMDDPEKLSANFIHKCEYVRAGLVAEKLKDMLGDPDKVTKAGKKFKAHYIAYDDRTNTVMVSGPFEKVNLAKLVILQLDKSNPNTKEESKAAQALKETPPSGVEGAMEKALKQNAEILFAEAKVREAEAELNRVQQHVLGKILATEADLKAARAIFTETEKRLEAVTRMQSTGKGGVVSDLDIGEAAVAVAKYKGDVARKEAELNVLMGKLPNASRPANSSREPAPTLRTYVVANGNAAEMGKVLQDVYKESSTVRFTAMANTQIMVYAPAAVQDDIAKLIEASNQNPALVPDRQVPPLLQGKNVANLFRTMALPIKVDFPAAQVKNTVAVLSDSINAKSNGINLLLAPGKNNDQEKMPAITLPEPITLAATLQLIEDMSNIRFIVRDYGIVGMAANDIPPGAILLSDIVRGMPITMGSGKKKS